MTEEEKQKLMDNLTKELWQEVKLRLKSENIEELEQYLKDKGQYFKDKGQYFKDKGQYFKAA